MSGSFITVARHVGNIVSEPRLLLLIQTGDIRVSLAAGSLGNFREITQPSQAAI